jgi:hypothetical protein
MNILTFDIEEWALAKVRGYGSAEKYAEYDGYLATILDVLDERGFKGTFFCTGMMAVSFQNVIRLIHSRGHEVGCHSYRHDWLNKMSEADVKEDTRVAVDALEQCIGQKIKSYRAPAFSIGENNKWTFEILAENGIERDASIFPAARDFGGFKTFRQKEPCLIYYNGIQLKEFPVCTIKLLGHETAYSGGGFFRFFPLNFVLQQMGKADYNMTYFHIGDLVPENTKMRSKEEFKSYYKEECSLLKRYLRYLKSNVGRNSAFKRMLTLINRVDFMCIQQANDSINWNQAPKSKI